MRKFTLYVLLLLFCLPSLAQTEKPEFTGVWQLYVLSEQPDGSHVTIMQPCLKIFYPDGVYKNIWLQAKDNASVITGQGTYQIINGNTYTEHVEVLSGMPNMKNVMIKLEYIFANDNQVLITSFKVGQDPKIYKEMWKRIDIGRPEVPQRENSSPQKATPNVVEEKPDNK